MELSKNLGLKIVDLSDEADIEISSENFKTLDKKMGEIMEKTQEATEDKAGISTFNDWREVIEELSGSNYNGKFGSELKEIKKDKSYLYTDSLGNKTIYKAVKNNTNSSGFLVPDSLNFRNITNKEIDRKYNQDVEEYEYTDYPTSLGSFRFFRFGKRAFFFMFYQSASGFTLLAGAKIADFPNSNFIPHGAFIDTEHTIIIKNSTNQENARFVIRRDGIYVYGAQDSIIHELKGTMHYITN